jgi:crotonobetainyl-CoA:carnitine CoA-transferase CaiB-like acyl-CoA transferase
MTTHSTGPLAGIKVLDLGTMVAGPVAATLLGDFGAEVIKIEQPKGGDPIRQNGPMVDGEGLWWNVEGRNKKSVTLDLRVPSGQEILRGLAAKADVLVENFRPGTLNKWGIGFAALKEINPRLVMLSISGYGQTGPYASRAAYDRIGLAFSGLLNITGDPDRPPLRPGTAMADYQSAIMVAFSVMMALYHRDAKGGSGQHIDVSLFESIFRFTDVLITAYDKLGVSRQRAGNLHFAAAPGDHFETEDGRYLALTVSSNGVFQRLCKAMNNPDLANEAKFASHAHRWAHIREINGIVGDWIKSQSVEKISHALDANGLAYSLIYSAADIAVDPHYEARGTIATVDNPRIGPLKVQAPQPRLSATPAPAIRVAPELGAETDLVLKDWLGFSDVKLNSLRNDGVI